MGASFRFKYSQADMLDTNRDGLVSKEEIHTYLNNTYEGLSYEEARAEAETVVQRADIDGSGRLSAGEMALDYNDGQQINRQDFEAQFGTNTANTLFNAYDLDNDGTITSDEIKSRDMLLEYNIPMIGSVDYSSATFKSMDANKDNFVTEEEMYAYSRSQIPTEEASDDRIKQLTTQMMTAADIDGNGKMSMGEWALHDYDDQPINRQAFENKYGADEANKLFNTYDTNKDGTITSDEIKAYDKELEQSHDTSNNQSNSTSNNKSDNKSNNTSNNKSDDKSKGLSAGAIAGIVVGAVCFVGLIVGLIVYFVRRNKNQQSEQEEDVSEQEGYIANKNNHQAQYNADHFKQRTVLSV